MAFDRCSIAARLDVCHNRAPIRDIRYYLTTYLAGWDSLETFGDWPVPANWEVDRSDDRELVDLTYETILRLAEDSNKDRTEDELKGLLRPLVPAGASRAVTA